MSELQFFGHIIDNEEVESLDGARFDVWNPWTREVWAQAAEASPADAARAVESARQAPSTRGRGRGWGGSSGRR